MVFSVKEHKVRKGETLEEIAKKFKFKKWETIWNDRKNAKLKSSRKLPRAIKQGDILVIPFNDKETRELILQKATLQLYKLNDWRIENIMIGHAEELEKTATRYEHYIKESDGFYRRLMSQLGADLKKIKTWGDGVDMAAEFALMAARLGKLAKDYRSADPDKLSDVNKRAEKIASDFALDGVNKISAEARKTAGKYLNKYIPAPLSEAIGEAKVIKDSYANIQKPSFWATTVASLLEGKSWSASVTRDLSDESKQRILRIDRQRMQELGKMQKIRNKCLSAAADRRREAKNAANRIKVADKILDLLPAL